DERLVGPCLLDGVQIFPLDVLDQSQGQHFAIRDLFHDRRDVLETGDPGGSESSLADDELVPVVAVLAKQDRLKRAGGLNREPQVADCILVEIHTWLEWIRVNLSQ